MRGVSRLARPPRPGRGPCRALGAGKTTFAKAYARALGVTTPVTSPSYTLVHHYRCGHEPPVPVLLHADLWRLDAAVEVADLGLDEPLAEGAAAIIEWGDRFDGTVQGDRIVVVVHHCRRRDPTAHGRPLWVGAPRRRAERGAHDVRLLGIETATAVTAIAANGDGVAVEVVADDSRRHTEVLAPAIASLLAELGWSVQSLDGVVVDVGPGLFTGLRVGVATAKGLAVATGVGLFAVTSTDAARGARMRLGRHRRCRLRRRREAPRGLRRHLRLRTGRYTATSDRRSRRAGRRSRLGSGRHALDARR